MFACFYDGDISQPVNTKFLFLDISSNFDTLTFAALWPQINSNSFAFLTFVALMAVISFQKETFIISFID